MNLSLLIVALSPIALGAACISHNSAVQPDYNAIPVGQAVLTGHLRSPEITLYSSREDANAHNYKNCISGIFEDISPSSAIIYDKKFVEIKGRIEKHYIPDNDIDAIVASVKNNCNSSKVFFATQIRALNR